MCGLPTRRAPQASIPAWEPSPNWRPTARFFPARSGFANGGLNFAQSIAIDNSGNAWIANFGNSTVTKLNSKGNALSPAAGYSGGGLNFPVGIAIDAAGDAWVANQSNNSVTELASDGAPRSGPSRL